MVMGLVIRCKTTGKRLFPQADGSMQNKRGETVEFFDGRWRKVKNGDRLGWFRFNEHYDRDGYCDNPARGY